MKKRMSAFWAVILLAIIAYTAVFADQEKVSYTYDDAGRLVTAAYSVGYTNVVAHYQYDANGNRTGTITIAANDTDIDSNADGMPDLGELAYFGGLDVNGADDPDSDGLVNSNEMLHLGNPFKADTDDDKMSDVEEYIAGTILNDPVSYFIVTNIIQSVGGNARVEWNVKAGRTYQLQSNAGMTSSWSNTGAPYDCTVDGSYAVNQPLATNIFYRTRVQMTD